MTATTHSPRTRSLPRAPLATCMAALLSTAAASASERSTGDDSWMRIRSNPTWPVLGTLSGTRSGARLPSLNTAVHVVTNCDDDGAGSLRAAVADAADGDTIDLTSLRCGRISLETGALAFAYDNLEILGPGESVLTIDGNDLDRVLLMPYSHGSVALRNLTVANGHYRSDGHDVAFGGCIAVNGDVTLDHVTVRDCIAEGVGAYGGGVLAYSLTMDHSTISGNLSKGTLDHATTAGFGGGAFVYAMQIVDSTISGNRAVHQADPNFNNYAIGGGIISVYGGGIYNSTIDTNYSLDRGGGVASFSSIWVSNSTISGNLAANEIGGGLFLRWPSALELDNSTVTANRSGADGAGVWLNAAGSYFQSSIVFGNTTIDRASDVGNEDNRYSTPRDISVFGHNNLMLARSAQVDLPADTLAADPGLAPLAYNGGTTRTHALAQGSPAIDAGSNARGLTTDQRGGIFARIHGEAADIGAYEWQGVPVHQPLQPVPALSAWVAAALAGLMAVLAAVAKRRPRGRRRRA